jgi:hypothetical protein
LRQAGRFCFALRSQHVNEPKTYGTWGGALDDGESPTQGVQREVEEESGYKGAVQLVPMSVFRHASGFEYHNFLAVVPKEFKPHLDWENAGYVWVDYADWPSPLHPGVKELLRLPSNLRIMKDALSMRTVANTDRLTKLKLRRDPDNIESVAGNIYRDGTPSVSLVQINKALKKAGAEETLVRGKGYYYFIDGDSVSWPEVSVYVYNFRDISVEGWVAEWMRLKKQADRESVHLENRLRYDKKARASMKTVARDSSNEQLRRTYQSDKKDDQKGQSEAKAKDQKLMDGIKEQISKKVEEKSKATADRKEALNKVINGLKKRFNTIFKKWHNDEYYTIPANAGTISIQEHQMSNSASTNFVKAYVECAGKMTLHSWAKPMVNCVKMVDKQFDAMSAGSSDGYWTTKTMANTLIAALKRAGYKSEKRSNTLIVYANVNKKRVFDSGMIFSVEEDPDNPPKQAVCITFFNERGRT